VHAYVPYGQHGQRRNEQEGDGEDGEAHD
jgi:hypothetical protein